MLTFKDTKLPEGGYKLDEEKKSLVVLHFTAGTTAQGALDQWISMLNAVSTPYILETDGTVCKTYPECLWSYHLGESSEGHRNHRRSVGIEIVNPGPLRLVGDTLFWWPKNFTTKYCGVGTTERYITNPFRGEKHWATFTPVQIAAVVELVTDICDRNEIPKVIPSSKARFETDVAAFRDYQGVCSHVNFRKDKFDLAPGQADPIWNGLLAAGFTEL